MRRVRPSDGAYMPKLAPPKDDGPVLLWISRDQRFADNWAAIYAQWLALSKGRPMVAVFCLLAYPEANLRSYSFMIE